MEVQSKEVSKNIACRKGQGDWDLWLLWLTMGYWFSKQTSFFFPPYFILFDWDPNLPTSICRKMMTILDLGWSICTWMWSYDITFQKMSCQWCLKTFLFFNIETHCSIPLYMEEDTCHKFRDIPQEIMCICNKQCLQRWMLR